LQHVNVLRLVIFEKENAMTDFNKDRGALHPDLVLVRDETYSGPGQVYKTNLSSPAD
jgi:hypothetical protein